MAEGSGKLQLFGWTPELFEGLDYADREYFHFKNFVFNQSSIDRVGAYVDARVRHFVASFISPPDRLLESLEFCRRVANHFR